MPNKDVKFIQMSEDDWIEKYKPLKNKTTRREECNGWYYETYGKDDEYIRNFPDQNRIWTILSIDGEEWIVSGWHYVNRFGYFITKHPLADGETIEVPWGQD